MKAFEKWYTELPIREDAEDFSLETQAKYKKGWKAALAWVLEELKIEESYETFHARLKDEKLEETDEQQNRERDKQRHLQRPPVSPGKSIH